MQDTDPNRSTRSAFITGEAQGLPWKLWILTGAVFTALGGCLSVPLPSPPASSNASEAEIEQLLQNPPQVREPLPFVPFPKLPPLAAGSKTPYGNTLTEPWVAAMQSAKLGNGPEALQHLSTAEQQADASGSQWELAILRLRILLQMGRAADALEALSVAQEQEQRFLGNAQVTRAVHGEILVWLEDTVAARETVAPLLRASRDWSFPIHYPTPPSNLKELVAYSTAYLQSLTDFSTSLALEGRSTEALPWMELTEQQYRRLHQVAQHPLYGQFFHLPPESLYGRAINLAFLGEVRLEAAASVTPWPAEFEQAQQGFDALGFRNGRLLIEALKAQALLRSGRLPQAEAQALKALELARELHAADLAWRIAGLLGNAQAAQGKLDAAERSYRIAQSALDQVSGSLSSDRSRTRFGIGKSQIDEFLIDLGWSRRDAPQLFADLERGRARAFMDLLADRALAVNPDLPEVQQLQEVDHHIVRQRLQAALSATASDPDRRISDLMKRRGLLLESLRLKNPDWAEIFSVESAPLAQIQQRLQPGERLIYTLPETPEQPLRLLVVEAEEVRFETLANPPELLGEALEEFVSVLGLPDDEVDAVVLLQEALESRVWTGAERVYVVPSGSFHFVPWGLLELDAPVITLPTGSWLLRKLEASATSPLPVVVGNPEFGGKLVPLMGAEAEAGEIATLLQTEPLLGPEATVSALYKRVGSGVPVLHLATHGTYDGIDPLHSAFYLTDGTEAVAVTAADLLKNPLPARLVVLSACETGLGKTVAGEDLLGLSRSFYLGSSVAVLASLWPVEDQGTRQFMDVFYRTAQRSGNLGQAWWAARNALKDSGASPSVYGAFVLGGSAGK